MDTIFEDVVQAAEAASTCGAAVQLYTRELEGTDTAIRDRIRRNREDAAGKITYNRTILENPSTSTTQKRIATLELSNLESMTFTATAEEILEFNAAKERATTALKDYKKARQDFRAAHDAAVKELAALKETVLPVMEIRGRDEDRIEEIADLFERKTVCGDFT